MKKERERENRRHKQQQQRHQQQHHHQHLDYRGFYFPEESFFEKKEKEREQRSCIKQTFNVYKMFQQGFLECLLIYCVSVSTLCYVILCLIVFFFLFFCFRLLKSSSWHIARFGVLLPFPLVSNLQSQVCIWRPSPGPGLGLSRKNLDLELAMLRIDAIEVLFVRSSVVWV